MAVIPRSWPRSRPPHQPASRFTAREAIAFAGSRQRSSVSSTPQMRRPRWAGAIEEFQIETQHRGRLIGSGAIEPDQAGRMLVTLGKSPSCSKRSLRMFVRATR